MLGRYFFYRLRPLLAISVLWIIFGIVFFENQVRWGNDVGFQISLLQFVLAFSISGFLILVVLNIFLKPALQHLAVWMAIGIKMILTLLLFFVLTVLFLMFYYILVYEGTVQDYLFNNTRHIILTRTFRLFMIDMGIMTFLSIILTEVADKYGPGMFWSMISGEYHKPRIENRIFIFLDINESTTIAEELGHEKYFRMLRRFFADITLPIMRNDGLIYQYVGDEVVLSWKNTPSNKIKSLKFIRNAFYLMERRSNFYRKQFGKVPRFKAGVHSGEVTAGFIGVIKRELIFSGDTVNTTARIRSMCHELNEQFVLSADFMLDFHQPFGYRIEEIGTMELKGRQEPTKLFSLNFE
jgi:adenylate cyclase